MPIYEYECADCGEEFEKLVKLSEAAAKPECPNCGGKHTQKRLSTFASHGFAKSAGGSIASCGSSGGFS
ncbi:MAG: zinc ribbon domain-containing protein [Chloroflexi bacterium]|nr:zinc ribbon domain-containing protein [Chloroflexota bacterium]